MRLLLDTHVLIWMLGHPNRVPATATALLRDQGNELVVSAVTAFELATKYRIGKLPQAHRVVMAYRDMLRSVGATELSISSHHGLVAGQLTWGHRDPFDRLLAAQSITEHLPLVTSDPVFATVGGVRTVWE